MRNFILLFIILIFLVSLTGCVSAQSSETSQAEESAASTSCATSGSMGISIDDGTEQQSQADEEISSSEYVILEDRVVSLYESNDDTRTYFTDTVNKLFATIPDGINKYVMISPLRIAFEEPSVKELSDDQQEDIEQAYFDIDNSVVKIDSYFMLSQHADPLDDIFFHLDHHWTQLGAYYAAEAFFQAADITYHDIGEYDKLDNGKFYGYLYAIAKDTSLDDYPDSFIYYKLPGVNRNETVYNTATLDGDINETQGLLVDPTRQGYATFVSSSSFSYAVIEGDPSCDRTLLVVGESYMNALSPWLADNFKTVVLVDPRYFDGGCSGLQELISKFEITDFLTVNSCDALSSMVYFDARLESLTE